MNLQDRWMETCQQLGIVVDQTIFIKLVNHYSQAHRHYHTLQHLEECFSYFDLVKEQATMPAAIEMALWLHDVIYDVKSPNNEQNSASWAVTCLQQLKLEQQYIDKIYQLIMVTAHQAAAKTQDEKIMVDVDLAILGAKPQRFAEYQQQIRKEYSWVPYFLYKIKRKAILKSFLERPVIYQTATLHNLLEKSARVNLTKAVKG